MEVDSFKKMHYDIGDRLKNGTKLLAYKGISDRRVVLAECTDGQFLPFVTWRMDPQGNCYWGHYFQTYDEAVADFNTR